jgi:hypothetical protein
MADLVQTWRDDKPAAGLVGIGLSMLHTMTPLASRVPPLGWRAALKWCGVSACVAFGVSGGVIGMLVICGAI